jgi:hypothetical protein
MLTVLLVIGIVLFILSMGAGSNHSHYSGRRGSYIGCDCSYSHNSLVDICGLWIAIALRIDFGPFALSLSKGER